MKPVRLVKTVVDKNVAVQTGNRLPRSNLNATTNPDPIPIKLIAT